jgi:hypothetical protein
MAVSHSSYFYKIKNGVLLEGDSFGVYQVCIEIYLDTQNRRQNVCHYNNNNGYYYYDYDEDYYYHYYEIK